MKIKMQQPTLLESFKGKTFNKTNMTLSSGQSKQTQDKQTSIEEQVKKLQAQRKKKAQELQKIEKMNLPKEEKERRKKAIQNELKQIDASILQLKSPKKKSTRKQSIDSKG